MNNYFIAGEDIEKGSAVTIKEDGKIYIITPFDPPEDEAKKNKVAVEIISTGIKEFIDLLNCRDSESSISLDFELKSLGFLFKVSIEELE